MYLSGILLPHGQEQWPKACTGIHTHAHRGLSFQDSQKIWLPHPKGWRIPQGYPAENSELLRRVGQGKPLWVARVTFPSQGSSSKGHDSTLSWGGTHDHPWQWSRNTTSNLFTSSKFQQVPDCCLCYRALLLTVRAPVMAASTLLALLPSYWPLILGSLWDTSALMYHFP